MQPRTKPAALSPRAVIVDSFRFLFAHRGEIFAVLWLPVLLAAIVLTVALKAYFSMLAHYLVAPDARFASVTVSVAAASYFVWLLLNVIGSARLTRLVEGHAPSGPLDFSGMTLAARLYTAMLRYQLVVVLIAAVVAAAIAYGAHLLPVHMPGLGPAAGAAAAALLISVFSVRCGMLMPALAYHAKRSVLRRGWRLTQGSFWPLAAVWAVVTALPAVLMQVGGEIVTRALMDGSGAQSIGAAADMLAGNALAILSIVATLTLSTTLFFAATTVASCLVWRALDPGA